MADDLHGKRFNSFDELGEWLDNFQTANSVQLFVRDSRTVAAAQKRMPKRQLKAGLRYYQIAFCCIHGGRQYRSQSSGVRSNQHTHRHDCPFEIRLSASDCGQFLEVKKFTDEHNHPIVKAASQRLPKQRRFSDKTQGEVACMWRLGDKNELIQSQIGRNYFITCKFAMIIFTASDHISVILYLIESICE